MRSAKVQKTRWDPYSTALRAVIPVRSPDYSYSNANKNSGLSWDEATFKDYIKDPRAKIPNTKMIFPGIKNEKEAGDLWAYLKQFGPDGNKK
jgi:cytochrome c